MVKLVVHPVSLRKHRNKQNTQGTLEIQVSKVIQDTLLDFQNDIANLEVSVSNIEVDITALQDGKLDKGTYTGDAGIDGRILDLELPNGIVKWVK
jgi:hypothetical protein